MKKIIYSIAILSFMAINNSFAQVPSTPSASVITPYSITIPRFSTSDINIMPATAKGTLVFDNELNVLKYADGAIWQVVSNTNGGGGNNYWTLSGTNLNSNYQSFSLLGGTNTSPIVGGSANDGTLNVFSPMTGTLYSGSQFITIDKNSIQARKTGIYPNFTKTEQNLRINPYGGNVGINTGTEAIGANLLVYKSSGNVDGSAVFKGTLHYSHFHYGSNEDTYIRGGKNTSNVIISDSESSGKVGIGIYPTTYKLEVNGTVRALEVIVDTGWADYVFEDSYKLPELSEVEQFIKQNKHLPEIPSAAEIQKNGAKMSELTTKMMQKIEELTLYSIEQKKELDAMKKELAALKKQ